MPEMADLHNHALFGVDDGAQTMALCEQVLAAAYGAGIRIVCFTPHYNPTLYACPVDELRRRYEKICAFAAKHLPGMQLYLGNEVFGYPGCVQALETGKCIPLGNGQAVLVEFSPNVIYREMRNCFLSLFAAGYIPVLAHAERYQCLLRDPNLIEELADMQVGIQINAKTLLQRFRFSTYRFAHRLLRKGLIDIVASDTHGQDGCITAMQEAYHKVEKKYGASCAKRVFYTNPKRFLSVKF